MDLSGQNHGHTSNILCSSGRQLLGDVTPAKAFGTYDEAVDRPELVWLRCWILLGHSGASAVSGNIWIEVDNAIESVARLECLKCLCLKCRSFFLNRELDATLAAMRRNVVTRMACEDEKVALRGNREVRCAVPSMENEFFGACDVFVSRTSSMCLCRATCRRTASKCFCRTSCKINIAVQIADATFRFVHTANWNQKIPLRLSAVGWNVYTEPPHWTRAHAHFQRKCLMLLVGNLTMMQFSGYDCQKRRIKDWNFCKRSHLQS